MCPHVSISTSIALVQAFKISCLDQCNRIQTTLPPPAEKCSHSSSVNWSFTDAMQTNNPRVTTICVSAIITVLLSSISVSMYNRHIPMKMINHLYTHVSNIVYVEYLFN